MKHLFSLCFLAVNLKANFGMQSMYKRTILFFVLFLTAMNFSCRSDGSDAARTNANAQVKIGVAPVADDEIAVIEFADNYGAVKIEFYSNIAPQMTARFKELAREGFYNGTAIHRVDQSLGIIQGGDPNSKDDDPKNDGTGSSNKPNVPAEFSDIPFDAGIVGAARGQSNDSANSQFFIMTKRQPAFDRRYTVFGKVFEGLNVVRLIAGAPLINGSKDHPAEKIVIKSVTIQKR
jgi:cyclophilin family peptidyl-prolyl cis-trans isomerase